MVQTHPHTTLTAITPGKSRLRRRVSGWPRPAAS
jgi:hypothetical protein